MTEPNESEATDYMKKYGPSAGCVVGSIVVALIFGDALGGLALLAGGFGACYFWQRNR